MKDTYKRAHGISRDILTLMEVFVNQKSVMHMNEHTVKIFIVCSHAFNF